MKKKHSIIVKIFNCSVTLALELFFVLNDRTDYFFKFDELFYLSFEP